MRRVARSWSIAGGGLITVAIAGVSALAFPALRKIDTFASLRPADDVARDASIRP